MDKLFYAPLERNEFEFFQTEILPPDELELFSKENFQRVISERFISSEGVVRLLSGRFLTRVFSFKESEQEFIFCLVDEYNRPAEYDEIDLDRIAMAKLKENLSIKLHYSEGIVVDQKINIINNYVVPNLKFNLKEEYKYYKHSYFNSDYIIFGPPGSGKTTLLRKLALDLLENDFSTDDFTINKLPIYIQLRDFNRYNLDFDSFIDFSIKNSFADVDHLLPAKLSNWGNLYLLLDGADEIDFEKFNSFSDTISSYKRKNPFTYFIITSRPDKTFDQLYQFNKCYIEPLSKLQIKELTYRNLGKVNKWKDFISILNIVPQVYDVLKNPLLLTLSHYLYSHKSILPTNTAQLLKEVVATLVSNWDSQRDIERKYRDKVVSPVEITHTLGLMSLYLSENKKQYLFTGELFDKFGGAKSEVEFSEFLHFIKFSTGMIEEQKQDHWSFIHKSIQDFFCSSILTESVSALKEKVFVEKDWEAILTMISGLSSDPGYIINNILDQPNRTIEEKLRAMYSFHTESMLLTRKDLIKSFDLLEEYFLAFEMENKINERDIKLMKDEITLMLKHKENSEQFLAIIKTIFDMRFSKYEYDFAGYLASSKSRILKTFYSFASKKGNMFVSYSDNLVKVRYTEESPEIQE